ncbi:hypothetical protein TNCV_1406021 [Trichonephila clavipes]|nr:hypothetical protein TNCV_1406021 [Trichonephila clavipes]
MGLYERKSAVLDGDLEWVCSTITSQNIYGRTLMILLTMRPSRLFVKIRCHAVASTRKRSAVRKKDDMILLKQASPIVNGAPALFYHYGDPSGCRHSPSSDNKQWPRALVILQLVDLKNSGQSMGVRSQQPKTSYLALNSW